MDIKKGEIVLMSSGEYSDYSVRAIFKAMCDFNFDIVKEEYLQLHPEQRKRYKFSFDGFVKWLVVDIKVLLEYDYIEICGGYWTPNMTTERHAKN